MKVFFKTFGCRTNIYDTQFMKNKLNASQICESEDDADIVVVNSCTVTNGADSGVRHYINSVRKKGKKVVLAGCGAINHGEDFFKQNKVFGVLGHSKKVDIATLLQKNEPFFELGNLDFLDSDIITSFHGKTKAFLKIQEGCNFRCSYCIIPFVRGNSRSHKIEDIVLQTKKLIDQGFSEFVLTGTNIGSYGKNEGVSLGILLQHLGCLDGVKRIRVGSIEPVQFDESLKEILDETWLERHLHIALQHTSETMLKIMRRRNSLQKDLELFNFLAQKGFALGTDFIVAHPGEDENIWQEALENFKSFPITHLHGFIYSKRDGTPSALMKQDVKADESKKRLLMLENIVKEKNIIFRKKQNTDLIVHVESFKNGKFLGFDQFYNQMQIISDKNLLKSFVTIKNYQIKEEHNETTF